MQPRSLFPAKLSTEEWQIKALSDNPNLKFPISYTPFLWVSNGKQERKTQDPESRSSTPNGIPPAHKHGHTLCLPPRRSVTVRTLCSLSMGTFRDMTPPRAALIPAGHLRRPSRSSGELTACCSPRDRPLAGSQSPRDVLVVSCLDYGKKAAVSVSGQRFMWTKVFISPGWMCKGASGVGRGASTRGIL